MNDAEKKFEAENGMSAAKAWDYVLKWSQEKKYGEAQKGCEEILRYFPEKQEARTLLEKIMEKQGIEIHDHAPQTVTPETAPDATQSKKKEQKNAQSRLSHFMKGIMTPQPPLPGMKMPSEEERVVGATCYFYLFAIIPLLLKRDSTYIQYHAWQGIVLTAMIMTFNGLIVSTLHGIGLRVIANLFTTLTIILYLAFMLMAYQGKWFRIPFVYVISEKLRKLF